MLFNEFVERTLLDLCMLDLSRRILITIDGPCAAGKTTLALEMAGRIQAAVIHTDDFVIPHEQKTKERLSVPGGNCDIDRLMAEVIHPWVTGKPIRYIKAYKDELPPRIVAQVKSVDSDIKETTVQSLKGAMKQGDYGVFFTLSRFTKNAQNFLRDNPHISGIDGEKLVDLILQHYEKLDPKYQDMIPLEKVYIPVVKGESK